MTDSPAPEPVRSDCSSSIRLGADQASAFHGERKLKLTKTEYRLLECLLREPGRVRTRAELMWAAIAGGAQVLERTIDQHICALRRKLGVSELIQTIRGR